VSTESGKYKRYWKPKDITVLQLRIDVGGNEKLEWT
jgi:hypothetical protein